MSNRITGIVVIFADGEFAVPDVNEVTVVDKATGVPVFNTIGDINCDSGCQKKAVGTKIPDFLNHGQYKGN